MKGLSPPSPPPPSTSSTSSLASSKTSKSASVLATAATSSLISITSSGGFTKDARAASQASQPRVAAGVCAAFATLISHVFPSEYQSPTLAIASSNSAVSAGGRSSAAGSRKILM